jgi:hypothetical protein
MQLHLLSVRPYFIGGHFTAGVLERVVVVYNHRSGDALDDGFEPGVQCAALHLVGGNNVSEAATSVSAHHHLSGREVSRNGMVAVVPQMRRNEDEGKDQRDHYVVMEAAALVSPEEIAFENTAHKEHFYCKCVTSQRGWVCRSKKQVFHLVRMEATGVSVPGPAKDLLLFIFA